jgi:hypothetical protein
MTRSARLWILLCGVIGDRPAETESSTVILWAATSWETRKSHRLGATLQRSRLYSGVPMLSV